MVGLDPRKTPLGGSDHVPAAGVVAVNHHLRAAVQLCCDVVLGAWAAADGFFIDVDNGAVRKAAILAGEGAGQQQADQRCDERGTHRPGLRKDKTGEDLRTNCPARFAEVESNIGKWEGEV